jgi:hypothetical protein
VMLPARCPQEALFGRVSRSAAEKVAAGCEV